MPPSHGGSQWFEPTIAHQPDQTNSWSLLALNTSRTRLRQGTWLTADEPGPIESARTRSLCFSVARALRIPDARSRTDCTSASASRLGPAALAMSLQSDARHLAVARRAMLAARQPNFRLVLRIAVIASAPSRVTQSAMNSRSAAGDESTDGVDPRVCARTRSRHGLPLSVRIFASKLSPSAQRPSKRAIRGSPRYHTNEI